MYFKSTRGIGPFLAVNALADKHQDYGRYQDAINYTIKSRNPFEKEQIDSIAAEYCHNLFGYMD